MRTRDKNAYRKDRIARGDCPECGRKNDRAKYGGYFCTICLKKHNETQQKFITRRVSLGLCRICGTVRDRRGWYCTKCLETRKQKERGKENE